VITPSVPQPEVMQRKIAMEIARWRADRGVVISELVDGKTKYTNVYDWWREARDKFPLLAPIAQRVLAIPATSVASERTASAAGNTVSYRRSTLAPDRVERLVMTYCNWQNVTKRLSFEDRVQQVLIALPLTLTMKTMRN